MKMKKFLAVLFFFTLATTSSASALQKIKISVPDSETSYICIAAKEFAKRVEEYSDGTLEFEVVPNGTLYNGDTASAIRMLSTGEIPIVILSSAIYTNFLPALNVISVPYMFDDQAQLLEYLNSPIATELFDRLKFMGITPVGKWTRSFREITNSKRPIKYPDDLHGVVLRVPNNALYVEFFTACGAVTTPMDFSGVYNALKNESLDGQENPLDIPYSSKFYEVQKYISFTNHMADAWVVGINTKFLKKLSKKNQKAIEHAGEEIQEWNVRMMAEQDKIALQTLIDHGMESNEITRDAQKEFIKISKSCYEKFKELIRDDALFEATAKFTGRQ